MNFSREDFLYLRTSGLLLIACLTLAAGAASYSYYRWEEAQKAHRTAQTNEREMQSKLAQASQEEVELKEKIARYLSLKQQGVVGPEKRLDWVEQLSLIRRERKLGDLQYELSAQHAVEKNLLPAGPDVGGHQFVTSTLKFTTSLLHEDDLLNLLGDIRQRLAALSSVRTCTLERRAISDQTVSLSYALKAECVVELVTLKEPGA